MKEPQIKRVRFRGVRFASTEFEKLQTKRHHLITR